MSADTISGNNCGLEFVSLFEFDFFSLSRTCHASQTGIKQEEILVSDGSEGLGFRLNLQRFLGFNGLMLAITPTDQASRDR